MGRFLGVDPGLGGAIAIIETINSIPVLVDAIDMPIIGSGRKARVDVTAAVKWISGHAVSIAYVERAQSYPGQGASSGFSYGRAAGAIEAAVTLARIPLMMVEPAVWKKRLHLRGKDKEQARQRALNLFPRQHELLKRRRDHNRAEAALIVVAHLEGPR
jgi:crossover junction endodeoxyribonuclease RuvC